MELKKLTDRIYYLPHEPEADRPMLAYVKGDRLSLAIDAGYSSLHVKDFYEAIEAADFRKPDFTAITHWHYDHTFGMHAIKGVSIAHKKTNEFLRSQQEKAEDPSYIEILKNEDEHFRKEYCGQKELNIVLSDFEFSDEITLNLGNVTARIFHTVSPHSEDTACIYIPEEKLLFLGDSTSEDFFNGGYMDKEKLASLIRTIDSTDCEYCVLSHCEPLKKEHLLEYLKNMTSYTYVTLRERPELKEKAAAWFHSKWNVPEDAYLACMDMYLAHKTEYGWYLCLDQEEIAGGLGVIENDFHDRKDLTPNICAVYTEEKYRCKGIAGRLLELAVDDLRIKGITPVYLITDHQGFYERYGWEFLCMVQGDDEPDMTRMYIHK